MVVQWLGLRAFTAKGKGSVPSRGTKIASLAVRPKKRERTINNLGGGRPIGTLSSTIQFEETVAQACPGPAPLDVLTYSHS